MRGRGVRQSFFIPDDYEDGALDREERGCRENKQREGDQGR
jgi:hypothetical protein